MRIACLPSDVGAVRPSHMYFKMVLCSFISSRVVVLANRIKSWDDKD